MVPPVVIITTLGNLVGGSLVMAYKVATFPAAK